MVKRDAWKRAYVNAFIEVLARRSIGAAERRAHLDYDKGGAAFEPTLLGAQMAREVKLGDV